MSFEPFRDRENVEWTNTWIESCTEPDKPRILIVGDSVTREIRSEMSKMFPQYAFDFIGSSSSFEDPCFYNILEAFFSNNLYHYQTILCNIGAKHCWYLNTDGNAEHAERYIDAFGRFVKYLQQKCSNILLLTTMPNKIKTDPTTWDEVKNIEIQKRNAIQTQVFAQQKLPIADLYSLVMQKQYEYKDHCHFLQRSASQELATYIMQVLQKNNYTASKPAVSKAAENIYERKNTKEKSVTKCKLFGFIPLWSVEDK